VGQQLKIHDSGRHYSKLSNTRILLARQDGRTSASGSHVQLDVHVNETDAATKKRSPSAAVDTKSYSPLYARPPLHCRAYTGCHAEKDEADRFRRSFSRMIEIAFGV